MKKNILSSLGFIAGVPLFTAGLPISFISLIDFFQENSSYLIFSLVSIILLLITYITYLKKINKKFKRTHDVAFIGYPGMGKTTMIVSMIGEIHLGKIKSAHATLLGESTIKRVAENLEKIRDGVPLGATDDSTKFGYTAFIEVNTKFSSKAYKVTYGDFPGEDSKKISQGSLNKLTWFKETDYFQWALNAECYVFVIDASCIKDKNSSIVKDIMTGYRTSWQHILDNNTEAVRIIRKRPIIIAFTKCDLFFKEGKNAEDTLYFESIDIRDEKFKTLKYNLHEKFKDLIDFFRKENPALEIIFTSSYGKYGDKVIGAKELFEKTLPQ